MFIANGNTNKVVKESKDDVLMKRRRGSNVMQLLQGGQVTERARNWTAQLISVKQKLLQIGQVTQFLRDWAT